MVEAYTKLQRADQFDFPTYAGFVNRKCEEGYCLELLEVLDLKKEMEIPAGALEKGVEVFSHMVDLPKTDALLVASPWVRVAEDTPDAVIEMLGRSTLRFAFHGKCVWPVPRPIAPYFLSKNHPPAYPGSLLYEPKVYEGAYINLGEKLAYPAETYGAFLLGGTPISMTVTNSAAGALEGFRLVAGLTCARYTAGEEDVVAFAGKSAK